MILWIQANLGTILVGAVLLTIVGVVVINMINAKKQGKPNFSCNCSCCAMDSKCHQKK